MHLAHIAVQCLQLQTCLMHYSHMQRNFKLQQQLYNRCAVAAKVLLTLGSSHLLKQDIGFMIRQCVLAHPHWLCASALMPITCVAPACGWCSWGQRWTA